MLSLEELEKLPTPRVLAYFKKHRRNEFTHVGECGHVDDEEALKEDEEYFDGIRKILKDRDHVKKK